MSWSHRGGIGNIVEKKTNARLIRGRKLESINILLSELLAMESSLILNTLIIKLIGSGSSSCLESSSGVSNNEVHGCVWPGPIFGLDISPLCAVVQRM